MCKHAEKENGLHDLLEIMLESLMVAERGEFLREQEEECEKLAGSLHTKGLTQAQVGQVFDEIYGEHYSKSSISRMIDYVRQEVSAWLVRGLDAYYPIVFVDCVHIKVFRKKKAATEAFYVILGVTEEGTREVLGIYNSPIESANGWGNMFDDLHERGVESIGLMVADGLSGLDKVIGEKFPGTALQRCTTQLKRNMLARVRHGDKKELADDEDVAFYFTYLNYAPQIQSMIYTTNWIERLQKDFRRVTRMRGAMPDENSVIVLMGKTAMDKESYQRVIPRIREDATLFPVDSASKGD